MQSTFTSTWLKILIIVIAVSLHLQSLGATLPADSSVVPPDTMEQKLNMDAAYNRPFLASGAPVALGGYVEGNGLYEVTDGITEGLSFQARRLTIFMSANINKRIRFLTELEFEDGTKEINIEFAAMDIAIHPFINLRGGIVMNPIGGFNQNHDGPKWEFVERPMMAANLLPATWSNAGFGVFGKWNKGLWTWGYEAYLTNGFGPEIIDNTDNKTWLPASKAIANRFEESSNGMPLSSVKFAFKHRKLGEMGISHMGGVYNTFAMEGLQIDRKRRLDYFALDLNSNLGTKKTYLVAEAVLGVVDIPNSYTQQYGNRQFGIFVDFIQTVVQRKISDWEKAQINAGLRLEYVDWNWDTFDGTELSIGDEVYSITASCGFRPSSSTVVRLNYRYQWQLDILRNPASLAASLMLGFSTYF